MRPILLIGVPCSGKTWVSDQLKDKYLVLEQDAYVGKDYIAATWSAIRTSAKRVLINTPFSISKYNQFNPEHVYVVASPMELLGRYAERTVKVYTAGNITRQSTYMDRARESKAFIGNSSAVLEHLRKL